MTLEVFAEADYAPTRTDAVLGSVGAVRRAGRDRLARLNFLLPFVLSFWAQWADFWQFVHFGQVLAAAGQAVLVAVLLRSRPRDFAGRLAVCAAGLMLGSMVAGADMGLAFGLASANAVQAVLAVACCLALLGGRRADVARTMPCAIVLMCAGVLAPVAGSAFAAATVPVFGSSALAAMWLQGGIGNAVGVVLCLPCLLWLKAGSGSFRRRRLVALACVAAAAAAAFDLHVFGQPTLLLPVLVYVCFVDFGTALLALPVVAVCLVGACALGSSPFGAAQAGEMVHGLLAAQVFLLSAVVIVLPLALVLEERGRLARLGDVALDRALREAADKSRFIAMLSHEIRTPMNGIIGFADLLGATELSAEQAGYVRKTQGAAASLLKLVNDLLDLAKAEAGQVPVRRCAFGLRELCEDVLEVLRATPDASRVDLVLSVDPAVPERVTGDPVRLQQILLNLVANALAHTREGSVRLEAGTLPGQVDHIRFRVCDTGCGIAPERLKDLFRPFSQVDGSAAKRGGTGLGLAICKELVEQMPGGAIGVQSRLGVGSVFWFILALPEGLGEGVLF